MLEIDVINENRLKQNIPISSINPLKININGRRFRDDEINIRIADIYETIKCDLNWCCHEIKDPWRRAKQHMILLDKTFGENSIDQIRFDHFFAYTHICDTYKWINRSFQFLKVGGVFIASFVDFKYLFQKAMDSIDDNELSDHITELQEVEKKIFTSSDISGLYYHRTILTPKRINEYLKRSFFNDIQVEKSYHEVLDCDIYEIRAVKNTDIKLSLAPDGTLVEAK